MSSKIVDESVVSYRNVSMYVSSQAKLQCVDLSFRTMAP